MSSIDLYHETRIVNNLISRLDNIGSVNQIVIRITKFAVATFHLFEKILQNVDWNLNEFIDDWTVTDP